MARDLLEIGQHQIESNDAEEIERIGSLAKHLNAKLSKRIRAVDGVHEMTLSRPPRKGL